MTVQLTNIVWASDATSLPSTADIELDRDYVDELVEAGADLESVIEQVLYEDLPETFGAEVLEFVIASVD